VLLFGAGLGAARPAQVSVGVYPSGTSFSAAGLAPVDPAAAASLAMPIGGVDDATLLVRGAQHVSIVAPTIDSPLRLKLLFAHFVSVNGTPVPDALEPWDGAMRSTEQPNQPVWLQVTVPAGTAPGTYRGSVEVVADGDATSVPITVTVFNFTLPAPGSTSGALLTAFNVNPQSYGAEVNKLYGVSGKDSIPGLFSFLASYRISPNSWGYGTPSSKSGYTSAGFWAQDRAGQMVSAVGEPRQFGGMWIPIANNRSAKSGWPGGLSPYDPGNWCSYLHAVHSFWQDHGWLAGSFPYTYPMDEPGPKLYPVVRRQARVVHSCFPGSHVVITGKPMSANKALWNGGPDDVDVFVVLESRYYGEYTAPLQQKRHENRGTMFLREINAARRRGKQIWTYTYESKAHQTPGLALTEPVADPRMFADWAALEGITGLLRGQGMTSYSGGASPLVANDKDGEYVLVYPGRDAPIPSARLEVLREGIEDWEILHAVKQRHGTKAVVKLLSNLFSTTRSGAKLSCVVGCAIKATQPYSWPLWSKDATTSTDLAQMRLAALQSAAGG
jgi:hypothetical protein